MKLILTFVQVTGSQAQKILREETLEGESGKEMTKGRATKLIKRFHPEMRPMLVSASEFPADWLVTITRISVNTWEYVYAAKV